MGYCGRIDGLHPCRPSFGLPSAVAIRSRRIAEPGLSLKFGLFGRIKEKGPSLRSSIPGMGYCGRIDGLHPCRPPFGLPPAVAIRSRRIAEPGLSLKFGLFGRIKEKGPSLRSSIPGMGYCGRIDGLHPCRPPFGLPSAVAIRSRRIAEPGLSLKFGLFGRIKEKGPSLRSSKPVMEHCGRIDGLHPCRPPFGLPLAVAIRSRRIAEPGLSLKFGLFGHIKEKGPSLRSSKPVMGHCGRIDGLHPCRPPFGLPSAVAIRSRRIAEPGLSLKFGLFGHIKEKGPSLRSSISGMGHCGRIDGLHPCRPPFGLPSAVAIRSRRIAEPGLSLKFGLFGRIKEKGPSLRMSPFLLIGRSGRI